MKAVQAARTEFLAVRQGHQDFSEDTYRTLAAADNAVMLVDGAKGLEPQTRKLFEVVRMRCAPTGTLWGQAGSKQHSSVDTVPEMASTDGSVNTAMTC